MNLKCNIIYEDNSILVCEKPSGIPVQSKTAGVLDMESMLKNYIYQQKGQQYIGIVHRLDQPVEGVIVFAKTRLAAAELSRQVAGRQMDKYYLAVTKGNFEKEKGVLTDYLLKDGKTNTSRVTEQEVKGSKKAILEYEVLEKNEGCQLLKIHLITGRHHQIRVQLSHAGHPIVEDTKYNLSYKNKKGKFQMALCSHEIHFQHPDTKEQITFQIRPRGNIFSKFAYTASL